MNTRQNILYSILAATCVVSGGCGGRRDGVVISDASEIHAFEEMQRKDAEATAKYMKENKVNQP